MNVANGNTVAAITQPASNVLSLSKNHQTHAVTIAITYWGPSTFHMFRRAVCCIASAGSLPPLYIGSFSIFDRTLRLETVSMISRITNTTVIPIAT